jgi:hypothetical protein
VALVVDNVVAPPFPDVVSLEHVALLSAACADIDRTRLPGAAPHARHVFSATIFASRIRVHIALSTFVQCESPLWLVLLGLFC